MSAMGGAVFAMRSIGLLVFDNFQVMGLAALSAFEMANGVLEQQGYEMQVLSEHGGPVRSSLGFTIGTRPFGADFHDTTITVGSLDIRPSTPGFLAYLRQAAATSRRVAGICTGAHVLAEAGLLDGRRATTHWAHARRLQQSYPRVSVVEDRIYCVDGHVWTSAGMSAGIDLALAMVEQDFGREVARTTARRLVLYLRRTGGQSQFSTLLELEPKSDRVRQSLAYAKEHLTSALSVEELAQSANLSARQYSRLFREETGQSPAKAVENLRLEAARSMLEQGRLSLDEVAQQAGFGDRERMRRAFLRTFGQPPQVIRRVADGERAGRRYLDPAASRLLTEV